MLLKTEDFLPSSSCCRVEVFEGRARNLVCMNTPAPASQDQALVAQIGFAQNRVLRKVTHSAAGLHSPVKSLSCKRMKTYGAGSSGDVEKNSQKAYFKDIHTASIISQLPR